MTDVSSVTTRTAVKITPELRTSAISARTAVRLPIEFKLSHASVRAMLKNISHSDTRFSTATARNLVRLSPNFRWIDMFSDIVFPHDISENSDAATKFSTIVNEVASGHDQRLSRWDYPLMEYNVAYGVRTMEHLHDLIRFFRVMRGKLNSFRFLDKLDYTSSFAIYEESRAAEEITALDQPLGIGDDLTVQFQLEKRYDFETETARRPIYKPIEGTVIVAVNGVEIENFEVDHSLGLVTIVPRIDVEVPEAILTYVAGNTWTITPLIPPTDPMDGTLPILIPGEWVGATGFNTDIIRAVVVSSTETVLTISWPDGPDVEAPEGPLPIQLTTDNTPRENDVLTAGFHFHVPVRFDTDRIPVRLEYYGVGSASEIKLVEIRPDEE